MDVTTIHEAFVRVVFDAKTMFHFAWHDQDEKKDENKENQGVPAPRPVSSILRPKPAPRSASPNTQKGRARRASNSSPFVLLKTTNSKKMLLGLWLVLFSLTEMVSLRLDAAPND